MLNSVLVVVDLVVVDDDIQNVVCVWRLKMHDEEKKIVLMDSKKSPKSNQLTQYLCYNMCYCM